MLAKGIIAFLLILCCAALPARAALAAGTPRLTTFSSGTSGNLAFSVQAQSDTATPTPVATVTAEPTLTSTAAPSATSTRTATHTSTPTPEITATPLATHSSTPTPSATATPTLLTVATPDPLFTATPTPISSSATPTLTSSPTGTASSTPASSVTTTPTATQTITPTSSETTTPTVSPTAGPLAISDSAVGNFAAITLDGHDQSTDATLGAFSVSDTRGTGDGWHVTVEAEQFRQWDGGQYVVNGRQLAGGSLMMSRPNVTAADGTISAAPIVGRGPYTIDDGGAVTIAAAAAGTGMGDYDFGATTLTLSVAASSYATDYRSTVTVSVISGP